MSKQTVSFTINADLLAQAKRLGINTSQIAEQALAQEVARLRAEQLRMEIRQDLEAANAYAEKHGVQIPDCMIMPPSWPPRGPSSVWA